MSIIIVTDQMKARLDKADGPIELCAADGKLLGYFTPSKPKQYRLEPPGSSEELDRRFAAGGGRRSPAEGHPPRPGETGMNYTVIWLPEAENELAAIWTASQDQAAVTHASAELDRRRTPSPASPVLPEWTPLVQGIVIGG